MEKRFSFSILIVLFIALILSGCSIKDNYDDVGFISEETISRDTNDIITFTEDIEEILSTEIKDTALYTKDMGYDKIAIFCSIELENTSNVPIKISDVSFDIENEDGDFVTKITGYFKANPEVILPGEISYISEDSINEDVLQEDCFKIIPNYIIVKTEQQVIRYNVEDVKLITHSGSYWGVQGRVVNHLNDTAEKIRVNVALYDSSDKLLGVIEPYFNDPINPNSKLGFSGARSTVPQSAFETEDVAKIVAIATSLVK